MSDLISREAVCNIVDDIRDCISVEGYWAILERLKKLSSVKPQEPCFWEKCPYYEPDIMFDGKDEYDMGKCTYKQEPKTGHWINAKVGKLFPSNDYKCSECGNILDFDGVNCGRGDANFCPNCGAKMVEPQESEG